MAKGKDKPKKETKKPPKSKVLSDRQDWKNDQVTLNSPMKRQAPTRTIIV